MNKVVIKNAKNIVTVDRNRSILQGDILIEGNIIKKIGNLSQEDISNSKLIDAKGKTVLPGFIQTHIHLCQTLFRNLADELELLDWLEGKIWPFESAHSPETLAVSAQLGITELLKSGTTTLMDMATVYHTDSNFEQIEKSGIRAFCGKAMMDDCSKAPKSLQETTKFSIEESLRLKKDWHNKDNGRIKYAFAPRFVLSCSDKLLRDLVDIAYSENLLIHTHASENKSELQVVRDLRGMDNIEYFHSIGLTHKNLCVAHCIWLNETEYQILKDTETKVLHCPSSNLKLGSGIAKIPEMLKDNIHVSIGADGAPCNNNLDVFQEMRLAALIQNPRLGPKALSSLEVIEMATINGAKALGIENEIGSLEVGKKADLVMINLNNIHSIPSENIYSQIIYSTKSSDIDTVMVDGKVLVEKGSIKSLDESKIISEVPKALKQVLDRLS